MADIHIDLTKVFDIIKEAATKHEMLADSAVGDEATRGYSKDENEDLQFPYLWARPLPSQYQIGQNGSMVAKNYIIEIFIGDKHEDNARNDEDITSDTESILSDIIQYLANHPELRKLQIPTGIITASPAFHATKDEVFGWFANVTIRVPYNFCVSNLPIDVC